ncbi:hypothetical protein BJ742DRAFT_708330 [Cladochytrium replicatum]|nr:hypothetical protein BJ742DRAFT_708330 [Cladochytrium replicatum]
MTPSVLALLLAAPLVARAAVPDIAAADATNVKIGRWDNVTGTTGVVCIHTAMLPGPAPMGSKWHLMCMERPHVAPYAVNAQTNQETTVEIDPWNGNFTTTHVLRNPFCSGHSLTADGRLLVIGGDEAANSINGAPFTIDGRNARRLYTPMHVFDGTVTAPANTWNLTLGDMAVNRWYPTVLTLADGTHMIVSGSTNNLDFAKPLTTNNPTYEYYPTRPGVWPKTVAALSRAYPFNLYPPAFQLPRSGKVFVFIGRESILIDPTTPASTEDDTTIPPLIRDAVHFMIYPFTPTVVILPLTVANNWTATIQVCGGTLTASNSSSSFCFQIRPEDPTPQWADIDPMPFGKVMPDAVLLPDGKVFYTNGGAWGFAGGAAGEAYNSQPPAYESFLYDPNAAAGSRFTRVPDATVGRLYHSGALLTPDGRVVTTGNEEANWPDVVANRTNCMPFRQTACLSPFEYRMELYSPPYLFLPNPPSITKPPTSLTITYGSSFDFFVNADPRSAAARITMTRYASTTHSTNTDQRFVELEVLSRNPSNNRVVVRAPKNGFVATPGLWMLWVVAENGAVGKSVTVKIASGPATSVTVDPPLPSATSTSTGKSSAAGRVEPVGKWVGVGALTAVVGAMIVAVLGALF